MQAFQAAPTLECIQSTGLGTAWLSGASRTPRGSHGKHRHRGAGTGFGICQHHAHLSVLDTADGNHMVAELPPDSTTAAEEEAPPPRSRSWSHDHNGASTEELTRERLDGKKDSVTVVPEQPLPRPAPAALQSRRLAPQSSSRTRKFS
ncbi:hypothetical protein GN956_G4858 [Arapaima gigas]